MNGESLKNYFDGLAEVKAAGRLLSFSAFQLFYALQLISAKPVSRVKIAKYLYVGEGTTRTILGRLVGAGLVKISRAGCTLTDKGLSVYREFVKFFPKRGAFSWTELTPFGFNYGIVIRGGADKVGSGIEQRDQAIVVGAVHALIAVFQNGRLHINSVSDDIDQVFPIAAHRMLHDLEPQENDAIVIASGETALKAMHGAFAASWSMLSSQTVIPTQHR